YNSYGMTWIESFALRRKMWIHHDGPLFSYGPYNTPGYVNMHIPQPYHGSYTPADPTLWNRNYGAPYGPYAGYPGYAVPPGGPAGLAAAAHAQAPPPPAPGGPVPGGPVVVEGGAYGGVAGPGAGAGYGFTGPNTHLQGTGKFWSRGFFGGPKWSSADNLTRMP